MKAEITAPQGFRAAPEGHTVVLFEKGQIVTGWLAEEAVITGAARKIDEIAETLEHKSEPEPRRRGRPRKVQE
jgi:hypothetical protein